jgi:hypothetical protein
MRQLLLIQIVFLAQNFLKFLVLLRLDLTRLYLLGLIVNNLIFHCDIVFCLAQLLLVSL